ncbi:MAG: DUF1295 domain-containing protein [Desulfobacterales bacterium]|jgi:steroid 5-alpha reductase family enzyme
MDIGISIFFWNLGLIWVVMTGAWFVSLAIRNVTIVDSLWGLGFVLLAWVTFFSAQGAPARGLLICALVTLWGVRLAVYLTRRNWKKPEDPRYGTWRREAGERFWIVSLVKVFWIQALFLWVIALGVQYGIAQPSPAGLTWLDAVGALISLAGIGIESAADAQLARFKKDPENRGRVMDRGLWGWSRHPNYFGESLVWWGIFLIALSTPVSFWTIVSPVVITLVLTKMTGVALTEKTIKEKRPEYRRYIETVPAFFPKIPKKRSFS